MTKTKKLSENNQNYWLARRGLRGNPFERWNAEYDRELPNYFVDIGGFDELLNQVEPCMVFARRGCGKTAQRQMLVSHCRPFSESSQKLAVVYTYNGFERVLAAVGGDVNQVTSKDHVYAILTLGIMELLQEIGEGATLEKLLGASGHAPKLTDYIACFAPHLAFPSMDREGMVCPLHTLGSIDLLMGFAALVQEAGLRHCVVFVDGVDEFPVMVEGVGSMITFLEPLLGTMALIECPGMAFKFFLPHELEMPLRSKKWFRPDRIHISPITWRKQEILNLLGQRLTHFSDRRPPYEQLGQLCDDELAPLIGDEIVDLASGSPRAALMLASKLLKSHYEQPDPPEMIALSTWAGVKKDWHERQKSLGGAPYTPVNPSTTASQHYVLAMDEESGLVWLGGSEIRSRFTPQDYSVLLCLYRHKDEVCTKDVIAHEAWSPAESEGVSDQAITACIARLREVLRGIHPTREYIETIRSKKRQQGGYRLHVEGF